MSVSRLFTRIAPLALLVLMPAGLRAQDPSGPDLTAEEREWLENNTIRVGPAPNYPPMEFFDESGIYRGIVADYVALFEERLGVEFEIVQRPTWNDMVESTQRGEIDVWMEAEITDERLEYMLATEPYFRLPSLIIVRTEEKGTLAPGDLAGRRVAAVEGYATVDFLLETIPGIDLVTVPSIEVGLEQVAFGSIDAMVAGSAAASYYIDELGLTTLRAAGESGWEWNLAILSRKELPVLHEIFRKTLDTIEPEERRAIYRSWVSLEEPEGRVLGVPPWTLWVGGILVLLLLASLLRGRGGAAPKVRLEGTRSAWPVYGAAAAVIVAIVLFTRWAETRITERLRSDTGEALETVLNTTSKAVYHWFRERQEEAAVWAGHSDIQLSCRELSTSAPATLATSEEQAGLREQLGALVSERGYLGFFMLSPDGTVLASSDPARVGDQLAGQGTHQLLQRVLESPRGTSLGLPQRSSDGAASGRQADATMIVGAALTEPDGSIPCVLAFFIDPERDFTEILQRGRIGESGESYAFNREGRLISQSRFEEDLRRIGLIDEGASGILNVQVRDPGGNLVRGFRPEVPREEQPLTYMAQSATAGRSESNLVGYNDYRGVPVIGAWAWDDDNGFGITTEIDVSEAYASLGWVRRMFVGGAALVIALVVALTGMFSVDSTRRRRLEAQLTRQSTALDAAADAIAITNTDGTIEWINPAFTEITGYSFDEAVGQNPRVLRSGAHDEAFYRDMWATIASGVVWSGEVINRRKDGTLYTEEMSITPVRRDDGQIVNYVAIKRDITRRKRMEEELEQARLRMEDELNVGREIQMSMLPLIFPAFPQRSEFTVFAALEPAREVGGDFYDFFLIDEDRFCFCVGDVSGKGVPAALFMAVTKTLLKSRATSDYSPASIMTHVNHEISTNNESSMFVTIFLGILDVRTGELVYTNAGHNPPYIRRSNGMLVRLEQRHGPVVGAMDELVYKQGKATLWPGDQLLAYTDGVTEAMDASQQLYEEDRLLDLLSFSEAGSIEELVQATVEDVGRFQGKADQADDITVLGVQYYGKPQEDTPQVLELSVPGRLPEIERVNGAFNEFAETHGVSSAVCRKINIVFDELLNNIVSYAYEGDENRAVDFRVELISDRLTATISDDGPPFNPFAGLPPDTNLSLGERDIGGLGVHLVRNVMDEAIYNRRADKNVVIVVKYLAKPDSA